MKIEIELSDLEDLRYQLKKAEERNKELETQLRELSEKELNKKAVRLSYLLLDNYMATIFSHLGFGEWETQSVIINDNIEHWLGKEWWNSDRIKIEIGADIRTTFRRAFLSIGIITKEETEDRC